MPITQVETPSGVVDVEHPEGTPESQIIEFVAASQGIQPTVQAQAIVPEPSRGLLDLPLASERGIEDFSAMERFAYEFSKSGNLTTNVLALAAAASPIGMFAGSEKYGLWASPTELFGEGWGSMPVDERRQKILEFKDEMLREDYPELHRLAEEGGDTGVAGWVGAFFKGVADPSLILPAGRTIKSISALGALYGGAYEVSRGLLEDGEIDTAMAAATAAGGAVLGAGVSVAAKKLFPLHKSITTNRNKPKTESQVKKANEQAEELNNQMLEIQAEGGLQPDANILVAAAERLKMKPQALKKVLEDKTVPFEVQHPEIAKTLKSYQKQTRIGRVMGAASDILAPIDDRIGSISRPVLKEVNEYDLNLLQRTARYQDSIEGFEKLDAALPSEELKIQFEESLLNYEFDTALPRRMLKENGVESVKLNLTGTQTRTVDEIFDSVDETLKEIGSEWSELRGEKVTLREFFFPRSVADVDGLSKYFGKDAPSELGKMYDIKAKSLGFASRSELSQDEMSKVALDYFEGIRYEAKGGKNKGNVRQFKKRKITQVNRDMIPYYKKSTQTLGQYVREMAENIENAKLWDRLGTKVVDLDDVDRNSSIAQLISKKVGSGEIDTQSAENLRGLLEARFVGGKKSMNANLQAIRNTSNMLLLANFRSATTQLGDLFTNPYRYGAKASLKSIAQVVTGRTDVDVDQLGLAKIISTEFTGAGRTASWLDKTFALSFFRAIDRFGKNVSLQSAYNKHKALAKTEKGVKELREEYGDYLGARFDNYIRDLQAGVVTPDTKLVNFTEIVKMQPLTPTQKSKVALMNPNYGIFYMLKTYALRHLFMLKNDIGKELDKGNYLGAAKKLVTYMALVNGGNATIKEVKNWEDGKGFDPDRVPDHFYDSLLNSALLSRYAVENRWNEGDIVGLATDAIAPPLSVFSNISKDIMSFNKALIEGEELPVKWLRNIPVAGRIIYNIFYGGAEEFLEREAKERAKN